MMVKIIAGYLCCAVHFCGPQNKAAAHGLISLPQSASVRLKGRVAAACSAQQQLQIWSTWTSQCKGVMLVQKYGPLHFH